MDWRQELKESVRSVEGLVALGLAEPDEAKRLKAIEENYPISVPRYYLSLIEKGNRNDPIRKMCLPGLAEEDLSGSKDTSGEAENTVVRGLQHKYKNTALLLSTNVCAMYCRHCFRKRMVGITDDEAAALLEGVLSYVRAHEEIDNILVSGGDSLMLGNRVIERMLSELTKIPHIGFIRFGTRTPVVLPSRLYDEELLAIFARYAKEKPLYVVTQFNHPREVTEEAARAVRALQGANVMVSNQTVLLKGVNDSAQTLAELLNALTGIGVVPYYVFQCRPVKAVKRQFQLPLLEGVDIVEAAKAMVNGHAKRFKYVLSHETGKIEILGKAGESRMLFKYHQPKHDEDIGRIFSAALSNGQAWLDEVPGELIY